MRVLRLQFLFIFLFVSALHAQQYQVIHVKGEIIRSENGEKLKSGDKVSAEAKITFKTADAMAAVLDPDMGRYILKAQKDEEQSSGLIYVIKTAITPVRGGMSTRAGGINNEFDMKLYFAESPYVWAGNYIVLRVSKAAFPMDENNFFFIRYSWKGDQINKKLDFEDDKLIFSKEEVFKVDGVEIDPFSTGNFELFYYKSVEEESSMITEIEFVLIDQESLMNVYNAFKDRSKFPYNDVADMFSSMYGKCDPLQVEYNISNK